MPNASPTLSRGSRPPTSRPSCACRKVFTISCADYGCRRPRGDGRQRRNGRTGSRHCRCGQVPADGQARREPRTAHNDYVAPDADAYFALANRNTTVICQIESTIGLANLDAIAATPGVDILWVGHNDLSVSMGINGKFDHPDFLAALAKVVDAANGHGKL